MSFLLNLKYASVTFLLTLANVTLATVLLEATSLARIFLHHSGKSVCIVGGYILLLCIMAKRTVFRRFAINSNI